MKMATAVSGRQCLYSAGIGLCFASERTQPGQLNGGDHRRVKGVDILHLRLLVPECGGVPIRLSQSAVVIREGSIAIDWAAETGS